MRKKYAQDMKSCDDKKRAFIDHIKHKHKKTLEEYAFLSDIFGIICP
jgi:hypothetical protein